MLRRFVPLLVCLALALVVLLARLWDVQVVQHQIWAGEAANLVRSHGVDPFVRGAIRDRHGDLIVRDEERYALEFIWRDFRRGHPLGQIAMMRSLAMAHPIGLDQARGQLEEAAFCYVDVTPADLEEFVKGGVLDIEIDYVSAIVADSERERLDQIRTERRRSRAADLRFYILRLLDLKPRDLKQINSIIEDHDGKTLSYLELAAQATDREVSEVRRNLRDRLNQADRQLERLSELIEWGDAEAAFVSSPGERLVGLIEEQRRAIDDDTADALFRIAAGFSPTRMDEANLARLDLFWLRSALDWDALRMREWRASRGTAYGREVLAWGAGFAIARSKPRRDDDASRAIQPPESDASAEAVGGAADRVISACAHAFRDESDAYDRIRRYGEPEDWRLVERIAVLDALVKRLDRGDLIAEDVQEIVFPYQDPELPMAAHKPEELLELVYGTALVRHARSIQRADPERKVDAKSLAGQLFRVADDRRRDWKASDEELFAALLLDMHARLQARITDALDEVTAGGSSKELRSGVAFSDESVERAMDRRRYVVRDRSARSKRIGEEPHIDLVLLVTRYRDAFAGFRVTSTTRRIAIALGPDGHLPIASKLIGRIRSPFLVDMLRQQPLVEELVDLQRKLELPEADRRRILSLHDSIHQPGSTIGGSGLEAWFEKELSGEAGYREVHGLQDRIAGNRAPIYRGAVDGEDITLTIDIALQYAAEDVLSHPELPPASDQKVDDAWFRGPIGAIVLATIEGEVLVAASVPLVPGPEADPDHPLYPFFELTDGQRAFALERTLARPRWQPPGSVVKPLLAVYALEHLGLDRTAVLSRCDPRLPRAGAQPKKDQRAGFGMINCHYSRGHSTIGGGLTMDLRESLKRSCNVYFAALAEREYDGASLREAYRLFGFGTPTGVRFEDDGERIGLTDHFRAKSDSPLSDPNSQAWDNPVWRQFLGNGLTHIDTSVMQIARAYAGLASGALPEMTLVRSIAGQKIAPRARPLGIGREHLDFVRDALDGVINEVNGSAYGGGLGEMDLGFRLAAKTGSADLRGGRVPDLKYRRPHQISEYKDGNRKHTWLAGWFPSRAPRYVVVVYLHDTSATSGHSAVYIARQFLMRPEVKALVDGLGGEPVGEAAATDPTGSEAPIGAPIEAPIGENAPARESGR